MTTVTMKISESDIDCLISSLDFITSVNLPIDTEYLKPYSALKKDLLQIKSNIVQKRREIPYEQNRNSPQACKTCDD